MSAPQPDTRKKCPVCSRLNDPGLLRCITCGADLALKADIFDKPRTEFRPLTEEELRLDNKVKCPVCSRYVPSISEKCSYCGFRLKKGAESETKKIDIERGGKKVCIYCMGSGSTIGGKCTFCSGTGYATEAPETRINCVYCVGTGKTIGGPCVFCEGKGWVSKVVKKKVCLYCSGSGTILGGHTCEHCGGVGSIVIDDEKQDTVPKTA